MIYWVRGGKMTLGEKIKECRKNTNLSQEKLAEKLGVSRQAVTKWETDLSRPSTENLIALSDVLGIPLFLLTDTPRRNEVMYSPVYSDPVNAEREKLKQINTIRLSLLAQAVAANCIIQTPAVFMKSKVDTYFIILQIIILGVCSHFVARNHKYEDNLKQRNKNIVIELVYCVIMAITCVWAITSHKNYIGTVLIIILYIVNILYVNPKYMNRKLVFSKKERQRIKERIK